MKIIGFLVIFLSLSVQAQDCDKFKTGTFEVDNEDGTVSIIKRTKKYQTEGNGNVKLKDKIVWLSDCSYQLIPVKIKDNTGLIGDEILTFTFVKTFEYSYIVAISGLGDQIFEVRVYEEGYLEKSQE
ncbi:MAG: hypothetical protein P8P74_07175 [Crocinitomicaceae bacterium]|nr:hypothetical protein [Crocinitomicaceae bacterium]